MISTDFTHLFAASVATVCLLASIHAQDLTPKAPPQRRPIAIDNAFIHSIDGESERVGTLWFEAGILRGVGDDGEPVPTGAERIDARGLHVYPGLVGAHSQLGLQEVGAVRATRDTDEVGDRTPEARAAVAINPDSTVIPVTRRGGVLTVGVFPVGGQIPGRSAVVQLAGWTWEDMAISADAGVVVQWPAMPRRRSMPNEDFAKAEQTATQARREIAAEFTRAKASLAARAVDPTLPRNLRAESLVGALTGATPTWIRANRLEQIESAVDWAITNGLRPTIIGGRDAPLCIDLLREHDVPIVVTGTHRLPSRRDSPVDAAFRLPIQLEEAGVRWCLASSEPFYNERNLPFHAATAVAHGLPHDAAIRAITRSAAEILGVGDHLGTLEVGKRATLIITDGDPLELLTRVKQAFISGRRIDLSSKQTQLAKKYRAKYRQLEAK